MYEVALLIFLVSITFFQSKKRLWAGHQWLTPVILATWEAEIGRIVL
jgi:hypothetical protein